jgi:flavodoxin
MLDFAEKLPILSNQKCFIFSTSGIQGVEKVKKDHEALRMKLINKGLIVIDEFSCKGFNTNSFLKFFGGMNKGRPNENDLNHAKEFALELLVKIKSSK